MEIRMMHFTQREKEAVACVLGVIIRADGRVAIEETEYLSQLCETFHLTLSDVHNGKYMEPELAFRIISDMDDEKKASLGYMMNEMIEADGIIDDREKQIFSVVSVMTGIGNAIERVNKASSTSSAE